MAALSFLSGLGWLARLDLADCAGLDSLAPLAGLGARRSLRLDNLLGLGDAELAHLPGLGTLEELSLCGWRNTV